MAASEDDRCSDPTIEDDLQELPPHLHELLIAAFAEKLGLPILDLQVQTSEGKPLGQIAREHVGMGAEVEDLLRAVWEEVQAFAVAADPTDPSLGDVTHHRLEQLLFQPVDWVE